MYTREINFKEIKEAESEHTEKDDSEQEWITIAAEKHTEYFIGDGRNKQNNDTFDEENSEEQMDFRFEPTFKSPNSHIKTLYNDNQESSNISRKSRKYIFEQRMQDIKERLSGSRNFDSSEKLPIKVNLEGTSEFTRSNELSKDLFNSKDLPLKQNEIIVANLKQTSKATLSNRYEEEKSDFDYVKKNMENDKLMKDFLNFFDTNDSDSRRLTVESKNKFAFNFTI